MGTGVGNTTVELFTGKEQESPMTMADGLDLEQAIEEAYERLPADARTWMRIGMTLPSFLRKHDEELGNTVECMIFNDGGAQGCVPPCPDRGFWLGLVLAAEHMAADD